MSVNETARNLLILFQVTVGFAWIAFVVLLYLALMGITLAVLSPGVLVYWAVVLLGPVCLSFGSLALLGSHRRVVNLVGGLGSLGVAAISIIQLGPPFLEAIRSEKGTVLLWGAALGASLLTPVIAYTLYWDDRRVGRISDAMS